MILTWTVSISLMSFIVGAYFLLMTHVQIYVMAILVSSKIMGTFLCEEFIL